MEQPRRIAVALGAVYLLWGSTYLGIRLMVEDIPPLLGGGLRFLLSGLLLLALVVHRGGRTLRLDAQTFTGVSVLGFLLCAAGTGFVGLGERHISSAMAALLASSVPLWVMVMRLFARERISWLGVAGAAAGFGGVALLLLPNGQDGATSLYGSAMVLLAAAAWALGSWIAPQLRLPVDILAATSWQMILGGLQLVLIGVVAGDLAELHVPSTRALTGFFYLALFSGLIGYTAYAWLLQNAPLGRVATFAYVNPLVAVALGWAILDEPIGAATLAASVLIVTSVAMTMSDERRVVSLRPSERPAPSAPA